MEASVDTRQASADREFKFLRFGLARRVSGKVFMKKLATIAILLVILAGLRTAGRAEDDPMNGTWKLNLSKSTFEPGPPPKALINKYESDGKGGVKVTTDNTSGQGKTTHREYTERYDGKEYSADSAGGDTITLKRKDAHTVVGTYRRNGKQRSTIRRTVSADGKTMTTDAEGESASVKGQHYHDIRVFDRQ
jgi:hypothetical protein